MFLLPKFISMAQRMISYDTKICCYASLITGTLIHELPDIGNDATNESPLTIFTRKTNQFYSYNKIPSHQLAAHFPTSRDNRAVVARAKSCSYKFVKIWIRKRLFSAEFLITSYKHVVREVRTWLPGNWEPDSVRLSGVGDGMYRAPWGGTFWQQVRKRNTIDIIFHLKLTKPSFYC